jgi:hypothetical protein
MVCVLQREFILCMFGDRNLSVTKTVSGTTGDHVLVFEPDIELLSRCIHDGGILLSVQCVCDHVFDARWM